MFKEDFSIYERPYITKDEVWFSREGIERALKYNEDGSPFGVIVFYEIFNTGCDFIRCPNQLEWAVIREFFDSINSNKDLHIVSIMGKYEMYGEYAPFKERTVEYIIEKYF